MPRAPGSPVVRGLFVSQQENKQITNIEQGISNAEGIILNQTSKFAIPCSIFLIRLFAFACGCDCSNLASAKSRLIVISGEEVHKMRKLGHPNFFCQTI